MRTFEEFCSRFARTPLQHVTKIKRGYFWDPEGLHKEAEPWDPFAVGIYLGEERGSFRPTPALLDLLAPHAERNVVVNEKAAWLFLCGRDVLMHGVVEGAFEKGEFVIVRDEESNVLGCGILSSRFDRKHKSRQYIKHLLDRGDYLRRER